MREVDLKLIELARALQGKIVTNDFNLNKVAQLRGVDVINVNELANSLKPVVLPGEIMKVFILKEGKEYNQGVAYLDDGTMVVVDNARQMISKTIDIVVTSVLQTTAGQDDLRPLHRGREAAPASAAYRSIAQPTRTAAPEAGTASQRPRSLTIRTGRGIRIHLTVRSPRITGGGRSSFSSPPSPSIRSCSARRRWSRACSIAMAISRTGARARGRG